MDLKQNKLSKSEWESIEVPVSENEKEVLQLIIKGYDDVNIKYNKYNSLFSFLKIEYNEQMEDYLYNTYFSGKIRELQKTYGARLDIDPTFAVSAKTNPTVKKADLIRIEKNDPKKMTSTIVYEHLLIDTLGSLLKGMKRRSNNTWQLHYYTLYKLLKNNILHMNRHVVSIICSILNRWEDRIEMSEFVEQASDIIERNKLLLQYADMTLYEHQKQVFTQVRSPGPKLMLYIAPTGTGKTLSPIGISQQYRVIFVCAARHVGLALARAAISVDKKIAFAFGCASAADIRLHYFAAKEYTRNKKSGRIAKVDNSVGDKVEIMICDVKSYLPAMYYMSAFNPVETIVTYWDEPTITMDYDLHDLHETIHKNWSENRIPNVILSSATLPKLHELTETVTHFKEQHGTNAQVFNIVSHDCKKTIPVINKNGYVVVPHYLSEDYVEIKKIVKHCLDNLTLLRYFDLEELIQFIMYVEKNNYVANNAKLNRFFASLEDVTMQNIKLHYLRTLDKIMSGTWGAIYVSMMSCRRKRIMPNNTIDLKGNRTSLSSSSGGGAGGGDGDCAIYVTTKDAYTLTDGPTIFLANDVEKIAKFCIQQSNIPVLAMNSIMDKITFNNRINEQIHSLEQDLEDLAESQNSKEICADVGHRKKSETKLKDYATNDKDSDVKKLNDDLDKLRTMIRPAELNETFIPNKDLHLRKWADALDVKNAFTSDIDERTIMDIMLLKDVLDSWKILLLMGIGVFTNHESIAYTEIMKKLADHQKLYMIIGSSDYIYGTNYQFCHGYLSKDLPLTQEKIVQAMGRVGRNNIQQQYTIRLRDDEQIRKIFWEELDKIEVRNMNRLFSG